MCVGKGMPYYFSILKALGDDENLGWMCLKELVKVVGWFETVSETHEWCLRKVLSLCYAQWAYYEMVG